MLHEWKETFPMVSMRFPSKSLDHKEHTWINKHDKFIKKAFRFQYRPAFDIYTWYITHSQFSLGISRQISSSFVKELFSKTLSVINDRVNSKMSLIVTRMQNKMLNWKITKSIQSPWLTLKDRAVERAFKTIFRIDKHIFILKGKFMIFWKRYLIKLKSTKQ